MRNEFNVIKTNNGYPSERNFNDTQKVLTEKNSFSGVKYKENNAENNNIKPTVKKKKPNIVISSLIAVLAVVIIGVVDVDFISPSAKVNIEYSVFETGIYYYVDLETYTPKGNVIARVKNEFTNRVKVFDVNEMEEYRYALWDEVYDLKPNVSYTLSLEDDDGLMAKISFKTLAYKETKPTPSDKNKLEIEIREYYDNGISFYAGFDYDTYTPTEILYATIYLNNTIIETRTYNIVEMSDYENGIFDEITDLQPSTTYTLVLEDQNGFVSKIYFTTLELTDKVSIDYYTSPSGISYFVTFYSDVFMPDGDVTAIITDYDTEQVCYQTTLTLEQDYSVANAYRISDYVTELEPDTWYTLTLYDNNGYLAKVTFMTVEESTDTGIDDYTSEYYSE